MLVKRLVRVLRKSFVYGPNFYFPKLRSSVEAMTRHENTKPLDKHSDGEYGGELKNNLQAEKLNKLIEDNPKFHLYKGSLTSWSIYPDTLRFLYNMLSPGMSTLETGCGQTTVVFSIAGTKHTCITPNSGETERVKQYCAGLGLPKNITFIHESSDIALPCNKLIPSELDLVFIDGAHGFPAPIIDWHYTARKLKVGGILSVDDFKMPSVKILYDFLCAEEEWELISIMNNSAFFRKLQEPKDIVHWNGQKINAKFPGY